MPAIQATAGSAPRQALYEVRYTGKPGPEAASEAESPLEIEDAHKILSHRARAIAAHGVRALAAAGMRVRLSLDLAESEDGALTPDDAWWIQIGPWGVRADAPHRDPPALGAKVTALMLDRLRPYLELDAPDFSGAVLLSMHVLVDAVRRWVNPNVLAMLPPATSPGALSDSDQVLSALPLGLVGMSGVLVVALSLSGLRRRPEARKRYVEADDAVAEASGSVDAI
jgi:hypothetical protein